MAKTTQEIYKLDGISVVIGEAVSKDFGLVPLVHKIRSSAWFRQLVDELLATFEARGRKAYGFSKRPKLEPALVMLIAGLVLGRRTVNAMADSAAKDPLWAAVIGRTFIQRDLSRLLEVISDTTGLAALRRALLASACEGQEFLELDMDSSLLRLHGMQEGGAYNGHYHAFGLHSGWAFDIRTGRLAAIWHNEGNAYTSTGQPETLTWILDQGVRVDLARFDAGLIEPAMLDAIAGRVPRFACRIKSNAVLDRLADPMEPEVPQLSGARSYAEFRYAAESWSADHRVVVKFQAIEGKKNARSLFMERFYFVSNLTDEPSQVVATYFKRGEAERVFGEFKSTFEPNFRHEDLAKNETWAQLLALAHNALVALREQLPKDEIPLKVHVEHRPAFLPEPWVSEFHRTVEGVTAQVRPLLSRVRDLALRVTGELKRVGDRLLLYVRPDILAPAWFPALMRA